MRGVTLCAELPKPRSTFLLTRLMRGVTAGQKGWALPVKFLLTRLMRGVTTDFRCFCRIREDFYSHASCEA